MSSYVQIQPVECDRGDLELVEVAALPAGDYVIRGVSMTPEMIAAGVARLHELAAKGAGAAEVAEEVYFAMRLAAGDGRALRRVRR